ncbi:amino acid racemase [Chryseobacterium tructae]|uniref:Aspartate/glutamate racemase family protein n=1 Tax=Chryseobacterium tructae TaxID=1037380 RepID=A0ABV7XRD4_9FLAO|nr:amino acid racemase [Chryseobacterium tructae]MDN3695431.1 amino acid racemase [Chryseobacterium tructae]
MRNKVLGILGGMGPRSTTPFLEQVLDECQEQYNAQLDEEFPEIIIYSLPTPFYLDRPIDHELMQETIIKGLKKLENNGVDCIAMPCNSAHIYIHDLINSVNTPLLNIVEETCKQLPSTAQRITLLATKTTFDSNIYQNEIINQGHQFIFKESWQDEVIQVIQRIKKQKDDPENTVLWEKLMEKIDQEVDFIIIACTDLNVVMNTTEKNHKLLDSSKCLAHSLIKNYLS